LQHFEERLRAEGVEVDEQPRLDGSDTGTGMRTEGAAVQAQGGTEGGTGGAKKEARSGTGGRVFEALEPWEDENELEKVCSGPKPRNLGGRWNRNWFSPNPETLEEDGIETGFHPTWINYSLPQTPNP
jgi:hypothetical protein